MHVTGNNSQIIISMKIFNHNWLAILYFNFKMLPFKQAIHLPFDFYFKVKFKNLSGKIAISTKQIHRGMIKIGAQGSEMFPHLPYIFNIKGKLIFNGKCSLGCGGVIRIENQGTVSIGQDVVLGANNIIFCEDFISIGNETISSWECQIMDTDTHSIIDTTTRVIHQRHKPILIGENNWIGNHVIINKGTKTSKNTIMASYSLCNKDYTPNDNTIIGGVPAKIIAYNKKRHNDKI